MIFKYRYLPDTSSAAPLFLKLLLQANDKEDINGPTDSIFVRENHLWPEIHSLHGNKTKKWNGFTPAAVKLTRNGNHMHEY